MNTEQKTKEEVLNKHFDDNKVSFGDNELKELKELINIGLGKDDAISKREEQMTDDVPEVTMEFNSFNDGESMSSTEVELLELLEAIYNKGDFYTIWRKTHKETKTSISFLEHVKRLDEIEITVDTPFVANIKGPLQANRLDTAIQYDTMATLVIKQLTKLLSEAASDTPIGLTSAMSLEFYKLLKSNIIYLRTVLGGNNNTDLSPSTSLVDLYNSFVFLTKLDGNRPLVDNIAELNFNNTESMLPAFILAEGNRIHEMRHGGYENKLNKEEVLNKHFDDNKASFDDTELINEGLGKDDAKQPDDSGVRTHIINNTPLISLLKDMRILRHKCEIDGDSLLNILLEAKERYEKAVSAKSLDSLLEPLSNMDDAFSEVKASFRVFFNDGILTSHSEAEMLTALEDCYDSVLTKYPEVTPEILGGLLGAFHCIVISELTIEYESSQATDSDILNPDDVDDDTFESILNEYTDELRDNAAKSTNSGVDRGSDDNESGGNLGWWLLGIGVIAGIGYMAYNHWSTDSGDDVELLDLDELF